MEGDFVVMLETWLEKREWERLKERLPRGYELEIQLARRKNRKGRVIGGMVIGIRNGVVVLEEEEEREMERIMMKVVEIGGGAGTETNRGVYKQ